MAKQERILDAIKELSYKVTRLDELVNIIKDGGAKSEAVEDGEDKFISVADIMNGEIEKRINRQTARIEELVQELENIFINDGMALSNEKKEVQYSIK